MDQDLLADMGTSDVTWPGLDGLFDMHGSMHAFNAQQRESGGEPGASNPYNHFDRPAGPDRPGTVTLLESWSNGEADELEPVAIQAKMLPTAAIAAITLAACALLVVFGVRCKIVSFSSCGCTPGGGRVHVINVDMELTNLENGSAGRSDHRTGTNHPFKAAATAEASNSPARIIAPAWGTEQQHTSGACLKKAGAATLESAAANVNEVRAAPKARGRISSDNTSMHNFQPIVDAAAAGSAGTHATRRSITPVLLEHTLPPTARRDSSPHASSEGGIILVPNEFKQARETLERKDAIKRRKKPRPKLQQRPRRTAGLSRPTRGQEHESILPGYAQTPVNSKTFTSGSPGE